MGCLENLLKMIKGNVNEGEGSKKVGKAIDLDVHYINEALGIIYTEILKNEEKKQKDLSYK